MKNMMPNNSFCAYIKLYIRKYIFCIFKSMYGVRYMSIGDISKQNV